MLTKRTNILFDEDMWLLLTRQAKAEKTSVADIVRKAVITVYKSGGKLKKRQAAIDRILTIRPLPVKDKIDYKDFINEGQKY